MYGQIHVCARSLVLEKFGKEAWKTILEKSGCDDTEHFLVFHHYSDSITLKLVGAIAETLGVPVETVLEIFGGYFFTYCLQHGYDKMLKTLGQDFPTFIQNLDSLHSLLRMTYKQINAPSFRCETMDDGSYHLHYYSVRKGLHHIVTGLLKAVGKELFDVDVESRVIEISDEVSTGDSAMQTHVVFSVVLSGSEKQDSSEKDCIEGNTENLIVPYKPSLQYPEEICITPRSFCEVFPYHLIFDSHMKIKQAGISVQKMCPDLLNKNLKINDVFTLVHPRMPLSFHHILRFINASFLLESRDNLSNQVKHSIGQSLILKGQMIWMDDNDYIIFMCSPRLSSLNELMERKVFLSDIPLYDVTRELVLLNQQRIAEIEISKKLDETTAELQRTANALEKEKAKTDMLLHQMLPVKVANQLRDGKRVDAEKFEKSTILFSDIVTFTNIAAAVQPIDIVNMLNALYLRFDNLTNVHDVYKVETIGDAYMVVGGVPEVSDEHAEKVANFAMGMVEKSQEVHSPATNKPLQIRVGMHSGSVVAGVVGDKMPRYCLFGDTVNTASRMESHGVPGKIHVSPTTYKELAHKNYKFEERGENEIKGKGKMFTYFLLGGPNGDGISQSEANRNSQKTTDGNASDTTPSGDSQIKQETQKPDANENAPAQKAADSDMEKSTTRETERSDPAKGQSQSLHQANGQATSDSKTCIIL